MKYYHGGPAGLKVIKPPAKTGAVSTSKFGSPALEDKIYLTTSLESALMFSAYHDNPCIYQVKPLSKIEHDPDCDTPGLSFQCDKVEIEDKLIPNPIDINTARIVLFSDLDNLQQ